MVTAAASLNEGARVGPAANSRLQTQALEVGINSGQSSRAPASLLSPLLTHRVRLALSVWRRLSHANSVNLLRSSCAMLICEHGW